MMSRGLGSNQDEVRSPRSIGLSRRANAHFEFGRHGLGDLHCTYRGSETHPVNHWVSDFFTLF